MAGLFDSFKNVDPSSPSSFIKAAADAGSKLTDSVSKEWTDIKDRFVTPGDITKSIAKNGILSSDKYDTGNLTFPPGIGATHSMLININVSTFSNLASDSVIDQYGVADVKRTADGTALPRQTKRSSQAIRLYMPNTVVFSQANQYEDVSLTGIVANAAQVGDVINGQASRAAQGIAGIGVNPKVEIFFANTHLRTFQFDFLFAPTSEQEAFDLWNIIYQLRLHTAPELKGIGGLLWVPPSEFDITFYMGNGQENYNIPKINTCVMENLDVDYAPTGVYSTFTTGFPVSVRVTMRLKEVEVLHRQRVMEGF